MHYIFLINNALIFFFCENHPKSGSKSVNIELLGSVITCISTSTEYDHTADVKLIKSYQRISFKAVNSQRPRCSAMSMTAACWEIIDHERGPITSTFLNPDKRPQNVTKP